MIKDLWYKNAVAYCLHVGTYVDSNGDGIGAFEGLTRSRSSYGSATSSVESSSTS